MTCGPTFGFLRAAALSFALLFPMATSAAAQPLQVLVFGDSLSYGFDLPEQWGFPSVLRRRLQADGYDVAVWNGSVPGDASADGLRRINSALQYNPQLVIVEFGANDMLNRDDPRSTYAYLDGIIRICKARGARVILTGMFSLPKNGPYYVEGFNNIYPTLARRENVPLYPFFLAGAYGDPALMQADQKHPNALGTQRIVAGIAPLVEHSLSAIVARVAAAEPAPR